MTINPEQGSSYLKRQQEIANFARIYAKGHEKERNERAYSLPEGWWWFSSGMVNYEVYSRNPHFQKEGLVEIHGRYLGGSKWEGPQIWTMAFPSDNDGRNNFYADNQSEMVIVAPPKYFERPDSPPGLDSVTTFHEGRFRLVGTEEVNIDKPLDPKYLSKSDVEGLTVSPRYKIHINRYYIVPEDYVKEYKKLVKKARLIYRLKHPKTALKRVFHSERNVFVPDIKIDPFRELKRTNIQGIDHPIMKSIEPEDATGIKMYFKTLKEIKGTSSYDPYTNDSDS